MAISFGFILNVKKFQKMRSSLIIILFFTAGCLLGAFGLIPIQIAETPITKIVLYTLMFCVGISIGSDKTLLKQLRSLNWRLALLPVMTMIGTFLGCLLLWIILNHYTAADYLALGSGFAYYSLSSIFITEMRGVELGTLALLCNIMREVLALLFIPIVAKKMGPLAAITMGGATTFDTTLPIITQSVEKKYVVVSIFHGCILDLSVPFFVTFFCGLAGM